MPMVRRKPRNQAAWFETQRCPWATLFILCLAFPKRATAQDNHCPAPSQQVAVSARLESAAQAFKTLDADNFALAMDEVALMLPCLDAPITIEGAAEVHRMVGIRRFAAGEESRALESLTTARSLAPTHQFPADLFPEGHALVVAYEGLSTDQGAEIRVPVPREGRLVFDGTPGLDRLEHQATIFQHLDDAGAVHTTAYLFPTDPLPEYDIRPRQRNRLIWASGLSTIGAGAATIVAANRRAQFHQDDPGLNLADVEQLQAQANGATIASGLLTAMALSSGVAAIVVGQR